MKVVFKIASILLVLAFVSTGCSRKKNTFVSRNYHALTAKDNALYNGYNALDNGKESVTNSYVDNYWEILPVERMEVLEEVTLPGESKDENFARAEEKAVKAIQKHSMNIGGKEYNPQMDEAYLLLGKARYFDQRFVPAIEAFNYILYKYPASNKINQAKIWREKTNIRLENDELAIKNLKRLLDQEELSSQDLADATSMLAQAYINTKSLDSAITQLETASQNTKSNDERGRYRFIQAQLYNALGHKDSANIAFDRVIELNRRTPRIYMISAELGKINNFDYEKGNKLELYELLTDLEENRENRPYLDKIYYQTAVFHLRDGSDSIAQTYYNKALRTNTRDKQLRAYAYETLGNMSFDRAEYKNAGAYYDSTMTNLVENSKPYRIIKKKRDNLEDVIYYEGIATANDSILNLVAMNEEERNIYFEAYIEQLKAEREKAEKEKELMASQNTGLVTTDKGLGNNNVKNADVSLSLPGRSVTKGRAGLPGASASFYFYNPTTVAYGKNEFIKIWGDRPLEDNWRWSNKRRQNNKQQDSETSGDVSEDELLDPQFYISKIPTEEKDIDSIAKERNDAYYQLAIIYKEKFKEYKLSKDKLKQLLANNPEEKYIVPAKYNLYKVYELLGENSEAEIVKNQIISEHPESRYAQILSNPELASSEDFESPENVYNKLYQQFEEQKYQAVIDNCDKYISAFDGDPLVPKFELLKATASGRLYGYDAYAQGINYVALTYPNSDEGQQATQISSEVLPKLADNTFTQDSLVANYKAVFKFNKDQDQEIAKLKKQIDDMAKEITYFDLKTSVDVYDPNTKFLLVHGLKSSGGALGLVERLEKTTKKKVTVPYFSISSDNYRIVQIHKNLDAYLNRNTN